MIFLLLSFVFIILRVIPGDPVSAMLGPRAPREVVEQKKKELGLDAPLLIQYFRYLKKIFRGDFGMSYATNQPVVKDILIRLPATLEMAIFSMLVAIIIGIFTGAFAATNHNRWEDHLLRLYSIGIFSVPIFWLGLMLQYLLGRVLGIFPITGRLGAKVMIKKITGFYILDSIFTLNGEALIDALKHLVLPSITLGLILSGTISRLTRANMLETLQQEYVTSARARGLSEKKVTYSYALRNALLPIITLMGMNFAMLLGGAILTETTFSWPGLARHLLWSIEARDFLAIQGGVVFIALFIAIISLLVDIIYAFLDPRIRF